jgi:hypothetical protein
MNTQELKLTYEERAALAVIRKALQRKPELAAAILAGMSKEVASRVLSQGQKELTDMLAVSKAFSAAAAALVTLDKDSSC